MAADSPLSRLVLHAGSLADDLGYVALADLAHVLGGDAQSSYRVIGGHMVTALVSRWQLGPELFRETGDTDLGVPPAVARDDGLIGRLLELGYERAAGNRFVRPVDDVPMRTWAQHHRSPRRSSTCSSRPTGVGLGRPTGSGTS